MVEIVDFGLFSPFIGFTACLAWPSPFSPSVSLLLNQPMVPSSLRSCSLLGYTVLLGSLLFSPPSKCFSGSPTFPSNFFQKTTFYRQSIFPRDPNATLFFLLLIPPTFFFFFHGCYGGLVLDTTCPWPSPGPFPNFFPPFSFSVFCPGS